MKLQDFDYVLPPEFIAQNPLTERDQSRLFVLQREVPHSWEHRLFSHLPEYLEPGEVLVLNDTKVTPARLFGKKESGGKVEILLVRKKDPDYEKVGGAPGTFPEVKAGWRSEWECLAQGSGRLREKTLLLFDEGVCGKILGRTPTGLWHLSLQGPGDMDQFLSRTGFPPLPPYIRRNGDRACRDQDLERYQTVYAKREGAIAAPTAGLHFTEALLEKIRKKGVSVVSLTLHVGIGTFLPVKNEDVAKHSLEAEFFVIPEETVNVINSARSSRKKVWAVGTTVTRALESSIGQGGKLEARQGKTDLMILPGFRFRAVDGLITNFHLPRSTLLMLVSAFAGREPTLNAYEEAKKLNYRFYSYGDAMLIF
jgi:S-adenosylmethionine:tRNA ribosyltransferase-isomerase